MAEEIVRILNDPELLQEVTEQVFVVIDKNRSGGLDKLELKLALQKVSGNLGLPDPSDEDVEDAMAKLDTDRNGALDIEEFQKLIEGLLRSLLAQRP